MELALHWHPGNIRHVVKHLVLHTVSNLFQLKHQHTFDEGFPHLAAHLKASLEISRIKLLMTTKYGRVVDVLFWYLLKKGHEKASSNDDCCLPASEMPKVNSSDQTHTRGTGGGTGHPSLGACSAVWGPSPALELAASAAECGGTGAGKALLELASDVIAGGFGEVPTESSCC
jgi:hypothetical protein